MTTKIDPNLLYLWTQKRFDYYVGARTLWFNNQLNMGAMMFGYAIETQLKNTLSLIKECPRDILYRHDFSLMYEKAREFGLFLDVEVSQDLLDYVDDFFAQRYPSQSMNTLEQAENNMRSIAIGPDIILAYDDFILQLDQSIYTTFNNVRAAISLYAAKQIDTIQGRLFFHNNLAFIKRVDQIIDMLKEDLEIMKSEENEEVYDLNKKAYQEKVLILNNIDELMVFDKRMIRINPGKESDNNHAKNFSYPGKVTIDEDGNKVWSASFSNKIEIN